MTITRVFHLPFEKVTDPPHRLYVPGVVGVVLDLCTQPPDVDIDCPWFDKDIIAPYSIKEVLSIVDLVGPLAEVKEQFEFGSAQLKLFISHGHEVFLFIYSYVPHLQKLSGSLLLIGSHGLLVLCSPQNCLDPGNELLSG